MSQNTTVNSEATEKPKKVTKADFLVALDEINATLQEQIAEIHASQARGKMLKDKAERLGAETREILLKL